MNRIEALTLVKELLEKANKLMHEHALYWGYVDTEDTLEAMSDIIDDVNRAIRDARKGTPPV